jgi:hypothetical protein
MTTNLHTLLGFISHHADLAYGTVFLIAFSQSLALVGLLVSPWVSKEVGRSPFEAES